MKGYHKVKVFQIPNDKEVDLPEGWKPFGVADSTTRYAFIVARKWERVGD